MKLHALLSLALAAVLAPAADSGQTQASCTFRNGSGINPADYFCLSDPVVGRPWETEMSLVPTSGVSTVATALVFGLGGPTSGVFAAGVEVLIQPPVIGLHTTGGQYSILIPNDPDLIGVQLTTQGLRLEDAQPGMVFVALNALDLVLGV